MRVSFGVLAGLDGRVSGTKGSAQRQAGLGVKQVHVDCASLSYFGRPTDQRAWAWEGGCKRRIQRGGGWSTGPERSRPGFHADGDDEDRADFAGFRVARDLP